MCLRQFGVSVTDSQYSNLSFLRPSISAGQGLEFLWFNKCHTIASRLVYECVSQYPEQPNPKRYVIDRYIAGSDCLKRGILDEVARPVIVVYQCHGEPEQTAKLPM